MKKENPSLHIKRVNEFQKLSKEKQKEIVSNLLKSKQKNKPGHSS